MKSIILLWITLSYGLGDWAPTKHKEPTYQEHLFEQSIETLPVIPLDAKLIGRLANGIAKAKLRRNPWECGIPYEGEALKDLALLYAYQITKSAREYSDDSYKVNPWEMAGIIANESGFDRCALGIYPRKKAYELGLIKKRKRCISHTEAEVLAAIRDPRMQRLFERTGVDLGVSQMLSRFWSSPNAYDKQITLAYGCNETAREMRNRAFWHKNKHPSLYWRGKATPWYLDKIKHWVNLLGARKDEF